MTEHRRRADPARLFLGVLLARPDRLDDVRDLIHESDFYDAEHRRIWRAILDLADTGNLIDYPRVAEWVLKQDGIVGAFDCARALVVLLNPDEIDGEPLNPDRLTEWAGEIVAMRSRLQALAGRIQ